MTSHNLALLLAGASLAPTALAQAAKSATKEKPNIVIILVDDMGYGDLSCQYSSDMRTPNIDKLFETGRRFDYFYSNSNVSSPARAGLLTGRYPQMVGVPGVIRSNPEASWGYLSHDAVLLPQMLHRAGYTSAMIGKWHLGIESPNLPNDRGFDLFEGFLGDRMDNYYTHIRQNQNLMRRNREVIETGGTHATELFTTWAIDYVKENAPKKEPFFLYLAYNAPHDPLEPPKEWEERVRAREPKISKTRGLYVALIEHLDDNIGRFVAALRSTGQLDNTILIFTSDNGGAHGNQANNGPLRGYKGDMFEGGIRVPMAVCWNGVTPRGRNSTNLVMMSDLFPTLCEVAGVSVDHLIDGISVLPLLRGEEQTTDKRYIYWLRREHGDMGGKSQFAVRYGDNILMQNRPFEELQLFNLKSDPKEEKPLPLNGEVYGNLRSRMIRHYNHVGAVPWKKPGVYKAD
ncbi:hypothetical protein FACS1894159_11580 [Bacteroidia bacterium]|nr:hypothetical protein FACS1894159_11580 [Bacteroidia bacterium]